MNDKPHTWHYGLVARWWAEFDVSAGAEELAFYQSCITRYGQPALDLACGTGRVLLPLLRAGLDVDGCDISVDMLALCRERAAREGLAPQLYQQALHELDLPPMHRGCRIRSIGVYCAQIRPLPENNAGTGHDEQKAR